MNGPLPFTRNPDVVTLTVQVNGAELPGSLPILAVEVTRQVNRIPYARLRIADGDPANGDFRHSTGDLFLPGNTVDILAGYHGATDPVFSGIVLRQRVAVRSGASWLEVECRDPAFKMTLTRRNRHYEDMTDSDVAEQLLGEYTLDAEIAATDVTHAQLLQYQATDWDFLLSRLEANGQVCIVDAGKVTSLKPSLDADPEADIGYGFTLLELDAEFDARQQTASIRAMAWDPAGQSMQEATAADPGWAGNGNLSSDDLSTASDRQEDVLWHGGTIASDALQAWADGAALRARLSASRGRARFQGLANVQPGSVLQLSRIGDRFNGKVYITGVRHEFSNNNWTTDAEFGLPGEVHAERFAVNHLPAAGLLPAVSGLQLGVVTQLEDDPAGEHRIRVKVPLAGMDEQGVWARVATLDAGDGRGTFFRPEVDDEVVLGFFHEDPAQPVVLGMLHSSAKAPPLTASADNNQKTYVSRSGITLLFDDDKKIVSLKTPGGNSLTLTDEDGGILLEDQNGNKLTMNSDGIALESAKEISIKASTDLKAEGVNTEIKSSASFKAEGSASAEVSSSGTMTVKGSLVQIN
jgi:Rhs element Vgr protein